MDSTSEEKAKELAELHEWVCTDKGTCTRIVPIREEIRSARLTSAELVGVVPFLFESGQTLVEDQHFLGASWLYGEAWDRYQFRLFIESLFWYKSGIVKLMSYSSVEAA